VTSAVTTRFAPAPTGVLHLGHVVNAIWVWGAARALDGRVLLRIEDHDDERSRPEFERSILEDLDWLGLAADGPTVRQSDRAAFYEAALARLASDGLVDPKAPELRYPGTCRVGGPSFDETPARRIRVEPGAESFVDRRLGPRNQDPSAQCGDLLARERRGQWTYQFAVTVDDLEQGVDLVIRGEDLLESTGRQIRLARLLGRAEPPRFLHHGLIRRADGTKLSKANRDEGIRDLRAAGRSPESVLAEAARRAGFAGVGERLGVGRLADLVAASGVSLRD